MTPTAEDIIGGKWSGLREMADAVNRYDCTLSMIDLGLFFLKKSLSEVFSRIKLHKKEI